MANTYTEDQLNSSEKCFYCGLVQKLKLFRGIINDIVRVLVENECTISEAGLAFTQATIGQTKIAIEEGRL